MSLTQENIITSIYRLNGKDLNIHAITTGLISVKNNFLERKGKGVFSKVNILLGQQHAAFTVSYLFYKISLVSVWCFFAAVLSVIIYGYFKFKNNGAAVQPQSFL